MKNAKNRETGTLYGLLLGLVALVALPGLAGCGGLAATEMQFEKSLYGDELEAMMTVCMDLQKSGGLPGLAGGERPLEFKSDTIDFSARNEVSYPLRLNCFVHEGKKRHRFVFVKEAPAADWEFVQ